MTYPPADFSDLQERNLQELYILSLLILPPHFSRAILEVNFYADMLKFLFFFRVGTSCAILRINITAFYSWGGDYSTRDSSIKEVFRQFISFPLPCMTKEQFNLVLRRCGGLDFVTVCSSKLYLFYFSTHIFYHKSLGAEFLSTTLFQA